MSVIKPFTHKQQYLIDRGDKLTDQLKSKVSQALGLSDLKIETKRHCYIFSTPGAGKTFTVQSIAAQNNIKLVKVHGSVSMNAMTVQLATAVYLSKNKDIIVWIDDCDTLFMDEEGLNVMKGALDEERNVFVWNKNMGSQINRYLESDNPNDQIKGAALQAFQSVGTVGVEIPTDRVRFIITSNKELTAPSMLNKAKKVTKKMMHEAALRDRVIYEEFNLNDEDSWGWIASVVMNNDVLGLDEAQKHYLLDWMNANWAKLTATSMRAVKELAAVMVNYPTEYPDHWDLSLSKG
jgi:hypothetical protein